MSSCPYFPEEPFYEIRCDYLVGKGAAFKKDYIGRFCGGDFKNCNYYFHLEKWRERINEAMKEEEEE